MALDRTTHLDVQAALFEDAFGVRHRLADPAGASVDALVIHPALAAVPSFEFAVRERATRLVSFRHTSYARVRGVERGPAPDTPFRVLSDVSDGVRLSDLLAGAEARRVPIDINASLCLLRQLAPAVAMLHAHAREVAHGAIAPERLVVTPGARLLIAEYVFGSAIEQLRLSRERYWQELRVPTAAGAGPVHIDQRTDVLQIGMVALALILSRPLREDEFPARVNDILASTWAVSARGGFEPLPAGLRAWLTRALQLDAGRSFESANDARAELDAVLGDNEYVASPANLEAYLARYEASAATVPDTPAPVVPHVAVVPQPLPPAPPLPPRAVRLPEAAPPVVRSVEPAITATVAQPAPAVSVVAPTPPPAPPRVEMPPAPPRVEMDDEQWMEAPDTGEPARPVWWRNWRVAGAAAAVFVVLAAGASIGARKDGSDTPVRAASGTLEVTTNPPGVEALVDGVPRGDTPLVLALEPGQHVVELRGSGEPRTIPVTIGPGMHVAHFVEMPKAPAPRASRSKGPAATPTAATVEEGTPAPAGQAQAGEGATPSVSPEPVQLEAGALPPIGR